MPLSLLVASSDSALVGASRIAADRLEYSFDAIPNLEDAAPGNARSIDESSLGCVVVDLVDPSACDAIGKFMNRAWEGPILGVAQPYDVATAVVAMRRGAGDVVEKPAGAELIAARLRPLLAVAQSRREGRERHAYLRAKLEALPVNQRAVLEGIIQGKANKSLAAELGVSLRSIELWRSRLMKSLEAGSLAELIRVAILLQARAAN